MNKQFECKSCGNDESFTSSWFTDEKIVVGSDGKERSIRNSYEVGTCVGCGGMAADLLEIGKRDRLIARDKYEREKILAKKNGWPTKEQLARL